MEKRYLSVDLLRGLTVALMIVVNSLGSYESAWSPLLHADWNGFTLTDLIFPTFLFVVGNSMALSLPRYAREGTHAVLWKIGKRTLLIFLIGVLLGWFPFFRHVDGELSFKSLEAVRIFGVLQRIALAYGIAALLVYFLSARALIWTSVALLVGYWLLLLGLGDLTLEGNAVLKLDLWLVGADHLYKGEGVPFDPEGLLSTMPAVVNVLMGYAALVWFRQQSSPMEGVAKLLLAAVALVALAFWWDLFFPFNKKIWTSSYVLLTSGIDLAILAVLIYVVDIRQQKSWTYFFEVFGKNTLFIYILSGVVVKLLLVIRIHDQSAYGWIFHDLIEPWAGTYHGSGLNGFWIMLLCWGVGYIMDKRGVYIKV
jgi:predicted acyltransferase